MTGGGVSALRQHRPAPGANLADLLEAVVDARPDQEAVLAGDRRLSYAELDRRANALGHWLAGQGVGAGDRVAVVVGNRAEHIEAQAAAFKLRAVPVDVNPRYVPAEVAAILLSARPAAVICDEGCPLPALAPHVPVLWTGPTYDEALGSQSVTRPSRRDRGGDDLYLLYTSGTTGQPRGVVWHHRDLVAASLGGAPRLGARHRVLPASPLSHGTAQWLAWQALVGGGTLVLDPDESGFDGARTWELVERERVTFLGVVGDAFVVPLAAALEGAAGRWTLRSLSAVVSGGAALSAPAASRLARLLPGVLLVDGYGASETGAIATRTIADGAAAGTERQRFRLSPDAAVLAADGTPVAPGSGEVGRLARTGAIPAGYWEDADATAATFPVIGGRRWALTGDLATVAEDGTVVLIGRASRAIHSGGHKVHPEEVEALLRAHPGVADAVVVGVPHDRWGEQVTAVVEPATGAERPSTDGLAAYLSGKLARHKIPRAVVAVDRLVRSPSGKPDLAWAQDRARRR